MILIENKQIGDIPLLHLAEKNRFHQPLPFIIFVHGFTSAKEHNLHFAYLLAEKGFRVVLPEALHHGERQTNIKGNDLNFHFWDIVLTIIDELDIIKTDFERENLIDPENVGLAGTSMGGIVTLGALTKYPWIKAAVSLMGMPCYEKFALWKIEELKKYGFKIPLHQHQIDMLLEKLKRVDLSLQPEKLDGRPLLFWHGKKDPVVPYSYTYQFYESIRPDYEKITEKLQFITDVNAGHKVSREGLLKTVQWFEMFLKEKTAVQNL